MTPDYLYPMVRRRPPVEGLVVEGSTPVVAFGDPTLATVATLGINPSASEFLKDGVLRTGAERRLATLESLGAESLETLTDAQVAEVVADCASYFHRSPYKGWFDALDRLLRNAVDASYYDGLACHLDLIQWATDPIWSAIPPGTRQVLLDDGVPHLRAQLQQEHIRLVVLNGRAVIDQVRATELAELKVVGRIPLDGRDYELVAGTSAGTQWLGWSANLQAIRGDTHAAGEKLATWLRETFDSLDTATSAPGLGAPPDPSRPARLDAAPHETQAAERGTGAPSDAQRTSGNDFYGGNEYTEVLQELVAEKDPKKQEALAELLDRILREDG